MRFEMIENFSVTFSSLNFSFCTAAIISVPTPFKRLCNFALYFSCRKNTVGTTKIFIPPLIQRKKSYGLQPKSFLTCQKEKLYMAMRWKFIPSLFMAKTNAVECLKNKEFTGCSNFCEGVTCKKKTGKGLWHPLPVAVYIFETETESCDPVSDYLTLLRF